MPGFDLLDFRSGLRVPGSDGFVVPARGYESPPARPECKPPDPTRMSPKSHQLVAGLQVAQADRVTDDVCGLALVGRKDDLVHLGVLTPNASRLAFLNTRDIPEPQYLVGACRQGEAAVA